MKIDRSTFYGWFTFVALLVLAVFAVWWFDLSHIPDNFDGPLSIIDVLLFAMVSYVVWHPIGMAILAWAVASHIKEQPRTHSLPQLRVAFITTFVPSSESVELLKKTLPSLVAADYPHDTWLLDEGDDPAAKALCAQLGVHHYSRYGKPHYNVAEGKFAAKTKGGNHNSWYDVHGDKYDVVAQIDTDFVARKDFLTKTLGYFSDPQVAFVGTPQIYGNTDTSFVARGAAEQTYIFYGPFLRGLYGMDTTLLIGANHVIRVAALKGVDHYSPHITEDLLTGMKLHSKGWKSVYVHEPLAVGEGPTTWKSYFTQQMRWAYGCIDIFFRHSPKLFLKMGWRRTIYYFFLQQYYFMGIAMVFGIAGLMLYFLFGIDTATLDPVHFLALYVPLLLLCGFMSLWLQRYNVRPEQEKGLLFAGMLISIAAWPIFFLALLCVFKRKRLTYKVTPKGKGYMANNELRVFRPHFVIGLICAFGLVTSFFTHRQSALMVFWALSTTLCMFLLPFVESFLKTMARLRKTVINLFKRPKESVSFSTLEE